VCGVKAASQTLARNIMSTLDKHYPAVSQFWLINVDEVGGIVQVSNFLLSGRMGFVLHTSKIDPEMKSVVRAGGELLERHRVSRGRTLTLEEALRDTVRKASGELLHDA